MNWINRSRTKDVLVNDGIDFETLSLSDNLLKSLKQCGFVKPSPIQLKAIPLGKYGFDLIVKSKSGTGKTLVFGIIAIENINLDWKVPQALILAPTREIAIQIQEVLSNVVAAIPELTIESFIGGLPIENDRKTLQNSQSQIIVGAPGRINALINEGTLRTEHLKLLILDEADKLMEKSFNKAIMHIYKSLPTKRQIIVSSATYPNNLNEFLGKLMQSPVHVSLENQLTDSNEFKQLLYGIKQFVSIVESHTSLMEQVNLKMVELTRLLSTVSFSQSIIFFNYQTRTESVANTLQSLGWPIVSISAMNDQKTRLDVLNDFKNNKYRILLCTDLIARGIDLIYVDLVINFDLAYDSATYLHRMGRAGRFGSYGICVSIISEGEELEKFQNQILNPIVGLEKIMKVPKASDSIIDLWNVTDDSIEYIFLKKESELQNNVKCELVEHNIAFFNCSKLLMKDAILLEDEKIVESVEYVLKKTEVTKTPESFKDLNKLKYDNDRNYPDDLLKQAYYYAIEESDIHWNIFSKEKFEPFLMIEPESVKKTVSKNNKTVIRNSHQFHESKPSDNFNYSRYLDYFNAFYGEFNEIRPTFNHVEDFVDWRSKWNQYLDTCTEFIRQVEFCKEMNKSNIVF